MGPSIRATAGLAAGILVLALIYLSASSFQPFLLTGDGLAMRKPLSTHAGSCLGSLAILGHWEAFIGCMSFSQRLASITPGLNYYYLLYANFTQLLCNIAHRLYDSALEGSEMCLKPSECR